MALDKRLNDSLGSFDAKLRKEQQKVAAERDARQATVAGGTAADAQPTSAQPTGKAGADASGDLAGSAATAAPDKATRSRGDSTGKRTDSSQRAPRPGDLKSDKSASGAPSRSGGNGATAREIPDGSDDDIVARRIRKAAEQETDPELKDKLWKEYADYRSNTQGR